MRNLISLNLNLSDNRLNSNGINFVANSISMMDNLRFLNLNLGYDKIFKEILSHY
jgi:hypothetical protein